MPQMGMLSKADIRELWDALGVSSPGSLQGVAGFQPHIVWQNFNPYPGAREMMAPTQVFISPNAPNSIDPINQEDPITEGLTEIYFPFPGSIEPKPGNTATDFFSLAATSENSGTITFTKLLEVYQEAEGSQGQLQATLGRATNETDDRSYVVAARIVSNESEQPDGKKSKINVVYVADVDFLASVFLFLRARPQDASDDSTDFRFENVSFLLNIVDELTGDDAYISIRRHIPRHFTLLRIEAEVEEARQREVRQRNHFLEEYDQSKAEATDKIMAGKRDIEKQLRDLEAADDIDLGRQRDLQYLLNAQEAVAKSREIREEKKLAQKRDEAVKQIRRNADLEILAIQNRFKVYAAILPPIPPLVVGLLVFIRRRLREREGISRERLL